MHLLLRAYDASNIFFFKKGKRSNSRTTFFHNIKVASNPSFDVLLAFCHKILLWEVIASVGIFQATTHGFGYAEPCFVSYCS